MFKNNYQFRILFHCKDWKKLPFKIVVQSTINNSTDDRYFLSPYLQIISLSLTPALRQNSTFGSLEHILILIINCFEGWHDGIYSVAETTDKIIKIIVIYKIPFCLPPSF